MTMTAPRIRMHDISGQRRLESELTGSLTRRHTVGQALEFYIDRMQIPSHDLRWNAYSRGVRLDNKLPIENLPDADVESEWTVMPEVSAGR